MAAAVSVSEPVSGLNKGNDDCGLGFGTRNDAFSRRFRGVSGEFHKRPRPLKKGWGEGAHPPYPQFAQPHPLGFRSRRSLPGDSRESICPSREGQETAAGGMTPSPPPCRQEPL